MGERPQNALVAAKWLNIPTGMISVAQPDADAQQSHGQIEDESAVMYRGRAAVKLSATRGQPSLGRIRLPVHTKICASRDASISIRWAICTSVRELSIGNVFEKPLKQICEEYDADAHPICGPLLAGGPAALVTEYNLPHAHLLRRCLSPVLHSADYAETTFPAAS